MSTTSCQSKLAENIFKFRTMTLNVSQEMKVQKHLYHEETINDGSSFDYCEGLKYYEGHFRGNAHSATTISRGMEKSQTKMKNEFPDYNDKTFLHCAKELKMVPRCTHYSVSTLFFNMCSKLIIM